VSIVVEGSELQPFVTDSTGVFQVEAPSGDAWLIVTPASGFHSRRIYVNRMTNHFITLTPLDLFSEYKSISTLKSSIESRDMISSFEDIDPEKVVYTPVQSVDQFLLGNISGMYSTSRSGMPGSGVTAFLRGIKSMNTNSQPLIVIDGIPLENSGIFQSQLQGFESNPLNSIDPFDISNLTILKDNQASSEYGMRGSNGVILIETLKPTEVQTTIDFALRTGLTVEPQQIPQLSAVQHRTLANEVLTSSGQLEETFQERYPGLFVSEGDDDYIRYNNQTNWQDQVFSNGTLFDTYLKVMGGDEIARYGLSVGYMNHEGVVSNTDFSRFNIRFVGTFNVLKWLRMYVTTNLTTSEANLRESSLQMETSPILTALHKTPMMSPFKYDEDGNQLQLLDDVDELGVSNPLAVIDNYKAAYKNTRFLTSFRFEGDISSSLKINSLLGLNSNKLNESVFMPNGGMELYYNGEVYNAAKSQKNALRSFYFDSYLIYSKELSSVHQLGAKAGIRMHTNKYQADWAIAKNSHESDQYTRLSDGVGYLREMGGDNREWNRLAGYASLNYSFREKYILRSNVTAEYSSLTGSNANGVLSIGGEPYGVFYSVGAAWRVSSEPYIRDISFIEDLRLRVSYGLVGNDDIGVYSSRSFYTLLPYRETSGMIPSSLSDQTQKFETSGQWNTGLDLSLKGNRIHLTVDFYHQTTKDLLIFVPQSSYTGFDMIVANDGVVTNNGWEASLFWRIVSTPRFNWDIWGNISSFINRVEEINNGEIITPFVGGSFISREGESLLEFYGYEFEGVYSSTEDALEAGLLNARGVPYGAGDARFNDISGPDGEPDGRINDFDKTLIGSPIPDLFGGVTTSLGYGRFSLEVFIQWVTGREVFNYVRFQNEKMTGLVNQSTSVLSRWIYEGQETDIPRPSWNDPVGNADFSTRWIENGSYLRLKNLTLAYRIPEEVLFFRNLEVFITGSNLLTSDHYLGYDPEFSYSSQVMQQGLDYGGMPHTRRYIIGVKIGL